MYGADLNEESIEQLRSLDADGSGVFGQLVESYITDTVKQLVELKAALDQQDLEQVFHIAHTIKGSSSNFGARRIIALCLEIETNSRRCNSASLPLSVNRLFSEFDLVQQALRKIAAS